VFLLLSAFATACACIFTLLNDENGVILCYFQLLTIFVTGKIKQYMEFYNANKDFVSSLGNWFAYG